MLYIGYLVSMCFDTAWCQGTAVLIRQWVPPDHPLPPIIPLFLWIWAISGFKVFSSLLVQSVSKSHQYVSFCTHVSASCRMNSQKWKFILQIHCFMGEGLVHFWILTFSTDWLPERLYQFMLPPANEKLYICLSWVSLSAELIQELGQSKLEGAGAATAGCPAFYFCS